ncbi:hypothetical protein IHE55_13830 [Streptomyces pactum]|uniref:PE-PGRS family protein n=1 Tax=Streptomyces pactum TaxID=68249 RepID=A0ABS0NKT1_9ACTN|nr:hypothetical protein [Streptomyces pactum]MBH5335813.1 hypothetical protein [Streptomyces pactum]
MIDDSDKPLFTRATHAPWREILRRRWSGRLDRSLVLRDRDGLHHVVGAVRGSTPAPPGAPPAAEPKRAGAGRTRLWGYDSAYVVRLGEYADVRTVGLPSRYGRQSMDVWVLWWVHDPVQVVRSHTTHGWPAVRKDLDQRLRHLMEQYAAHGRGFGPPEMTQHLGVPQTLPTSGLSYRITDISAREDEEELRLGEAGDAEMPQSWAGTSPEEYAFCLRAVRDGPVSLAALWLVRHPDQVSQVLDWAVRHAGLLRGETTWQDEVAGMLGKLTDQERQELSELLRDRLVALGRQAPGRPGTGAGGAAGAAGPAGARPHAYANGWAGGPVNGQPA